MRSALVCGRAHVCAVRGIPFRVHCDPFGVGIIDRVTISRVAAREALLDVDERAVCVDFTTQIGNKFRAQSAFAKISGRAFRIARASA